MSPRFAFSSQPGAFYSGHFVFTLGSFLTEVPYDPNIPFDGEEDSMSIRAFTHGWDVFYMVGTPLILHMYGPRNGPAIWDYMKDDWWKVNQKGLLRLREMLTNENGTHNFDEDGR